MKIQSFASTRSASRLLLASSLLLVAASWSSVARGDPQHDLLFFLSLEGIEKNAASDTEVDEFDHYSTADILYTFNDDKFGFLGEYILSNKESELERLQAGWHTSDSSTIWIGRFHAVSKFWTTEYHHGQFLQTSISRPGLENWEDDSGPMPSHITGLLVEHGLDIGDDASVGISFAAGLGPAFAKHELLPYDLLEGGSDHGQAVNFRVAYRPSPVSPNQIGLALAWNEIPVDSDSDPALATLNEIHQATVSLFADWSWQNWRLLTNWVYFNNGLHYVDGKQTDKFTSAYVQGEFKTANDWTIFGRSELSFGEDNSPYLQLLPAFTAHRHMLGVRWDFANVQSLTLEIADTSTEGSAGMHINFKEARLQWSAVFP